MVAIRTLLSLPLALLLVGGSALASEDETILTLNQDGEHRDLTLSDIERHPLQRIQFQHPEGLEGEFSGVWLNDFLAAQGLDGADQLRFIAADHYTTFLTPEERDEKAYLLVTRLEGDPIALRQKGPLMLIVPADEQPVLAGTEPMTKWIWSITEIRAR
ncbi:hypothetical protein GCM10007160_17270 [Litchfieldella qijiaojingensis]|uniref:Oxidoreductase molybdopterin-binding domain-containing protein n=1 Tax=Litchfieldella qijiaojingensis TaxID=980347 RepID=A0ABQ2YRC9_9GAMM|nr:molybdopterin-dependent oxidoreductase [Halomonas qijiaojingensis]GGX90359.1 hypothetical protein GCM10007160_17270 [Halomonas qijiaojingensis]